MATIKPVVSSAESMEALANDLAMADYRRALINSLATPGQPVPEELLSLLAQFDGATLGPPALSQALARAPSFNINEDLLKRSLAGFNFGAALPPNYKDLLTIRATLPPNYEDLLGIRATVSPALTMWPPAPARGGETVSPPTTAPAAPQPVQPPAQQPIAPESLLEALRRALAKGELTEQQINEVTRGQGRAPAVKSRRGPKRKPIEKKLELAELFEGHESRYGMTQEAFLEGGYEKKLFPNGLALRTFSGYMREVREYRQNLRKVSGQNSA